MATYAALDPGSVSPKRPRRLPPDTHGIMYIRTPHTSSIDVGCIIVGEADDVEFRPII
jgi:hypothetical protein